MPSLRLSRDRILCCGLFKKKRRILSKINEKHSTNKHYFYFKLIILEYQSKRSSKKLGDFGIVNIVQEATPITPDNQPIISSNQSTINEEQTTTHQLAEQTSQMLDDIRKYKI
jgi:hypothetical protein